MTELSHDTVDATAEAAGGAEPVAVCAGPSGSCTGRRGLSRHRIPDVVSTDDRGEPVRPDLMSPEPTGGSAQ